jgi:hypothetical protein
MSMTPTGRRMTRSTLPDMWDAVRDFRPPDYDQMNAEQAASRQKAIAEGADEMTARLTYPNIDPNNPDAIN